MQFDMRHGDRPKFWRNKWFSRGIRGFQDLFGVKVLFNIQEERLTDCMTEYIDYPQSP